MTGFSRFAARTTVVCLLLVPSLASADPITISSGVLDVSKGLGQMSLTGDRGFTLGASVSVFSGIYGPVLQCSPGPCLPGTAIDLTAAWIGNDLPASITLDGLHFANVGSLASDTSASVDFGGKVIAPTLDGLAFLQSPFTFSGAFSAPNLNVSLVGWGMASIWFQLDPSGTGWTAAEVKYEFGEHPVVTPEPGTLILFASGLAAAFAAAFRRGPATSARPR